MIEATIIADSESSVTGQRLTTFQVEHPRIILAEMNKHRMLSNSYQSSRAVPIDKMNNIVRVDGFIPDKFGRNQSGMSAGEDLSPDEQKEASAVWEAALQVACNAADRLSDIGVHKQWAGRVNEPFQWTVGIITATEWDNFFYLRRDKAAQPEFKALADAMWVAYQESEPEVLKPDEWHTPYVSHGRTSNGKLFYYLPSDLDGYDQILTLDNALRYSAASVAQVSFRKLDQSVETLERVWNRCFNSGIPHAVVAEHQATPITPKLEWKYSPLAGWSDGRDWPRGVTHKDSDGKYWSGNLQGFIQHRQLIPNNTCWDYEEQ